MVHNLQPGQLLARGICRHLAARGFATLTEFVPSRSLRVDIAALGPKGEIWVVECKSSRSDFMTDKKWQGYLEWCDRFFWGFDENFPVELLPEGAGRIITDGFDAEIMEFGGECRLAAPRRKTLTQKMARVSMSRLQNVLDPSPSQQFELS